MRVEGVHLPASDAARLAILLRDAGLTDLSQRLGTAIDTDRGRFAFLRGERGAVIDVLGDAPDGLGELRRALQRAATGPNPER